MAQGLLVKVELLGVTGNPGPRLQAGPPTIYWVGAKIKSTAGRRNLIMARHPCRRPPGNRFYSWTAFLSIIYTHATTFQVLSKLMLNVISMMIAPAPLSMHMDHTTAVAEPEMRSWVPV